MCFVYRGLHWTKWTFWSECWFASGVSNESTAVCCCLQRSGMPPELLYSDDLVLMAPTMEQLGRRAAEWRTSLLDKGLKVNAGKSKVMVISSGDNLYYPFIVRFPIGMLLLSTHSLDPCLWGESDHPASGPPASLSQRDMSTNPGVTMWCVCECSWRDGVCGCYRGGLVVMDVFCRRRCVSMTWGREIYYF